MYDAKSEACEFLGESRAEAVAKACDFFGLGEAELAVADFASGDVYGLGGRTVIVARPLGARPPRRAPEGRDEGRGEGRREGRGRGDRDRGDRPRGGRGGRDRGDRGRRGRAETRGETRSESDAPSRAASGEPSVGTPRGELSEIGAYLLGILERMDLGPFEIGENRETGLVVLEVKGAAAEELAHGDGRPVDAIQLLVNQAASRGSDEPPRVVLDVEGDADAREAHLGRLAQRVARRARETGRAVALDPMNGRDRRMIHLALREEEGVATMSMGEGRYRQVVVVPEGAPEFEEAQRESESAASRAGS